MARGPWAVTGPWAANQTPEGLRQRYLRSILVLTVLLGVLLGTTVAVGELVPLIEKAADFVRSLAGQKFGILPAVPTWTPVLVTIASFVIPCSVALGLIQALPIFIVWWEMKIAAHIQVRLGPMRVGRWHGILQTFADGIKLLLKEDIVPIGADKKLHFLAPILVVAPAYICFAPIPFGSRGLTPVDLDVGLLFVLGVSGLTVIGLLLAGWCSNNKYSVLGGLRAAAQMVSYEIPRVIAVLPVVMWAGTMSLSGIADAQRGLWAGFLPRWFLFYPVVGQISFVIYIICSIAETNRTPFDIAEAESELTSGFHTEYSGMKWAMFFMAEYAYLFIASAVGTVLFLGGGQSPWPALNFIPSYVWFFLKSFFFIFLFIWIRWSYPRLRVDRLMEFCWKFLLPWSLANVVLAGFMYLLRS